MAPILLEVADDELLRDELEEFKEIVDDAPAARAAKRKVKRHLAQTRMIVAAQVPTGGGDDALEGALEAARDALDVFVEARGGLLQVDGEGFYEDAELILDTE